MSASRMNSRIYGATDRTKGGAAWATEFERIFVLGAARIRGEKLSANAAMKDTNRPAPKGPSETP
jgi:hypothetical protein